MNPFLSAYSEQSVAEEKAARKQTAPEPALTLTAANDDAGRQDDPGAEQHAANE
jgi:hypothetical protein